MRFLRPTSLLLALSATVAVTSPLSRASAQTAVVIEHRYEQVWSVPPPAVAIGFDAKSYPAALWTWPVQRAILYNHPPQFAIYPIDPAPVRLRVGLRIHHATRPRARRIFCCCGTVRR